VIRIGCSGWNYVSWRGSFYPKGMPANRWLEHYASVFDTVEVNTTFYRLAKREAVARWASQTPPEFCFAVKASRYLTHVKRLKEMQTGLQRLIEPLQPLREAGKLGALLWQLPANFHRDLAVWTSRSGTCRRGATPLSFVTPRGSARRSTRFCASTGWRWRSATAPTTRSYHTI